jgi:hypothetical protein
MLSAESPRPHAPDYPEVVFVMSRHPRGKASLTLEFEGSIASVGSGNSSEELYSENARLFL